MTRTSLPDSNVRDGRIMHPVVAASLGFDGGPKEKVRLVAAE